MHGTLVSSYIYFFSMIASYYSSFFNFYDGYACVLSTDRLILDAFPSEYPNTNIAKSQPKIMCRHACSQITTPVYSELYFLPFLKKLLSTAPIITSNLPKVDTDG